MDVQTSFDAATFSDLKVGCIVNFIAAILLLTLSYIVHPLLFSREDKRRHSALLHSIALGTGLGMFGRP